MTRDKYPREPVILSAVRTPSGKYQGALSPLSATDLGAIVVREAVRRAGIDPETVSETIMGMVVSAGAGQAPARQASIRGGLPPHVGAVTVNKVCGSGLKAVMLAANEIRLGEGDLYVAGGMESMSNVPHYIKGARKGLRYGHQTLEDGILGDGLWCTFQNWPMGNAAEFIADQFDVTREDMDRFALESHRKAAAATEMGKFKDEIVKVEVPGRKGKVTIVETDETIRPDTSLEVLAKLRPAFKPDGRVTAGNSPGLNDGASALVVSSREYAEKNGIKPMARILAYGYAAVEPLWLFYAPVKAIPLVLEKVGWTLEDVDLIELNEAFAAQVIADGRALEKEGHKWDWDKVNVNGGAIALGHPIGCSGARVLTTLIYALRDRGLKRGLAALCLGGGEAVAMAVELED